MKPTRHAAVAISLAALVALPACGDDDDDDTPAPADTAMTDTTSMTADTAMTDTTGG